MRLRFLIALIIVCVISASVWYRNTAYLCPIPLEYRIGEVDPSFELSYEDAKALVEQAVEQWEDAVNRDLFVYAGEAPFTVNFIFDERQAATNAEERERRFLDGQLAENQELFEAVEMAQVEYENLVAEYTARAEAYEVRLSDYNRTVQQYNDRGGAPEEEFAALEAERNALETEADALETLVNELNMLASRINRLSEEGNRLIDAYNEDVQEYNNRFGTGEVFTQGDYLGDSINIYEFSNDNELQTVLLHEFGHALGLGHVEDDSAIMYYLLGDVEEKPLFSAADLEEFAAVCGTGKEWDQLARQVIRNVLSIF
jgi:hypothetical protein